MKKLLLFATAVSALAFASSVQAADRVKFDFWYGLTGDLGEVMAKHCQLFNESQDKYEAVCTGQGGYDKAEQNTIAAYRAKQQPTIVQIYDAGTVNFMLSGAIYPAPKFTADYGLSIDWKSYIQPISNYYATSGGELWSFPYNSSTAVFYWNKDAWAKIGKTEAPKTWAEFAEDLKAMKAAGVECGFAFDFDTWQALEQFSATNNLPIASLDNGYGGLGAELVFNKTAFVDHMKNYKSWLDAGYSKIQTSQVGKTTTQAFADTSCASAILSIASHGTVQSTQVPGLKWGVAMLPVIDAAQRKNSLVGGASLWVMEGKSKEEYEAAAAYIKYIADPVTGEKFMVNNTGYIPVTNTAFDLLTTEGFYKEPTKAGREIAIASLNASPVGPNSRGIRLGNYTSVRAAIRSELEAAFTGQKEMQVAIDDAVKAGNDILRRYEQTYKGVALP
jgi:sn-glycerol 3-phosphate transport system substrate-binding protein